MVKKYRGIIIEESLKDKEFLKEVEILSTKVENENSDDTWHLHKVSTPKDRLPEVIKKLQRAMTDQEARYAHFYEGKDLVIIFKNKKFQISTDKSSWKNAIRYGLSLGIKREELDFKPCRIEDEKW